MTNLLLVATGGAIGASLRYLCGIAILRIMGATFPWAILFVNILGSLLMGIFVAWMTKRIGVNDELRLFIATGLLGGFTTFSAFSIDLADMFVRGAFGSAAGYVTASVVFSLGAVFIGLWFGRAFL